ncbi:beta-1,3-glucan recognition protein 1 [Calliopsis andreniformis]|uniref:beta-1,3-glucan recognition protein 1 n=1 Tax=Calliopsis andreniformis TaxID=337506 RepID=UPI003FCE43CB
MKALTKWFFFISLFSVVPDNYGQVRKFAPSTPTVEPLYPKGLRMSIPHQDGITLVAYHVKFNEDFRRLEAGTIAVDIIKTTNGHWTYEDDTTELVKGDVIYYWVHVVYKGLGYNLLDKHHVVNVFYNRDGTPVNGGSTTSRTDTCIPSETNVIEIDTTGVQSTRRNLCSGQLIFEENFNSLNQSRWTVIERFSDAPSYEFNVYMNDPDIVNVKDGNLHIKPILTSNKYGREFVMSGSLVLNGCTEKFRPKICEQSAFGSYILPPVISGSINTKKSFAFLYGRVQVRAKFPRGDWIYPIITLESMQTSTENKMVFRKILIGYSNGNPTLTTSNEEDISGHVLSAGTHEIDASQNPDIHNHFPRTTSTSLWSDDYHLYEVQWKNGQISVIVDGVTYGLQNVLEHFDTPVYINVGVAVGGHTSFPNLCRSGSYEKPWRNAAVKALYNFYQAQSNWLETWQRSDIGLHIDYIKVWAL